MTAAHVRRGKLLKQWVGPSKAFIFAGTGLTIAYSAVMATLITSGYRQTESEAVAELTHIVAFLEQSIESSIAMANHQVMLISDNLVSLSDADFRNSEINTPILSQGVQDIAQVDTFVLIDEHGVIVNATEPNLNGIDVSDRSYFQTALTSERGEYSIGAPIRSRGSGRRLTPLAWPLRDHNDNIRGVLASALGEAYFHSLLSQAGYRSDMNVEMARQSGEIAFSITSSHLTDGNSIISVEKDLPSLNISVTASRPRSAVFKSFIKTTIPLVTIATAMFISTLALTMIVSRRAQTVVRALTKSEAAKTKLLEAEREFDLIFQNVYDGIVIFEKDEALIKSNRKARNLLGADSDVQAVSTLRELLPDFDEASAEPSTFTLNTAPIQDPRGARTLTCRVMALDAGDKKAFYCVLNDITAEERLNATRNTFVVSVNHELRTPLTSLSGSLEIVTEKFKDQIPEKAMKLIAMASRNTERLLHLVNDILTLQAIDQRHISFKAEVVSAAKALEDAYAMNEAYGHGYDVGIVVDDVDSDAAISVDPIRLQQIFSNLISNAIKYSPRGGLVKISAETQNGEVIFAVSDKGPGIPLRARETIFDRFGPQVHATGVQASGTGLGLSITRELVEQQGGKIYIDSVVEGNSPVHGSTFFFSFPRVDINSSQHGGT